MEIVHITVSPEGPTMVGYKSLRNVFKLVTSRLSKNTIKMVSSVKRNEALNLNFELITLKMFS